MTKADVIASHGRIKNISGLSLGSFGRLSIVGITEIIIKHLVEIINIISGISKQLVIRSKL